MTSGLKISRCLNYEATPNILFRVEFSTVFYNVSATVYVFIYVLVI